MRNSSARIGLPEKIKALILRPWKAVQCHSWLLLILFGACVWILAYVGLQQSMQNAKDPKPTSFTGLVYQASQLLILNTSLEAGPENWWLSVARLLAPILLMVTAGKALLLVFREKLQLAKIRLLFRGHVVICGLGLKGLAFARDYGKQGKQVVVIEIDRDNPAIEQCRHSGTIVVTGNALDVFMLKRANLQKAARIICACRDEGVNLEICGNARDQIKDLPGDRVLECLVHIVSPHLCGLLQERKAELERNILFSVDWLNVYQRGARLLLNEFPIFGDDLVRAGKTPHILVIGLGRMGESLILQAERNSWITAADSNHRLRITVLDRHADLKVGALMSRHKNFGGGLRISPLNMDMEHPETIPDDMIWGKDGTIDVASVYVCLRDESLGVATAFSLHKRFRGFNMPIVVRTVRKGGHGALFPRETEPSQFEALHAFGLVDRTCRGDWKEVVTQEILARAVHYHYLGKMAQLKYTPQAKKNMVSWKNLTEDSKVSCRRQADHIEVKLSAIGCSLRPLRDYYGEPSFKFSDTEVQELAKMEHDRWMMEDMADKTHPAKVPWDQLSRDLKDYNMDTIEKMPRLLASVDLEIYRIQGRNHGSA